MQERYSHDHHSLDKTVDVGIIHLGISRNGIRDQDTAGQLEIIELRPGDGGHLFRRIGTLQQLARRQAEVIVTHHRPDSDYRHILAMCFSANRAKVGAAVAKAMAMRALSCMKAGTRRFRARSPDARYLEQDLHILGGPGVNMDALARVA